MNAKKVVVSFMVLSSLTLVGCSSDKQPTSEESQSSPSVSAGPVEADSQSVPEVTEEAAPSAFGEGLEGDSEEPVISKEPINNGLLVPLPSTVETPVVKNEKVTFTVTDQEAGKEFDAVLIYENTEEVDLGEFTADKDGFVKAEIVIPENLVPGKYAFALTQKDELFVAQLIVK